MKPRAEGHIIQIMPADGWVAAYKDSDTQEIYYDKLIAFALISSDEVEGRTWVVGLDETGEDVTENREFMVYERQP